MAVLALNWRVWAVLALLFGFALARRLWRQWRAERRRRRARSAHWRTRRRA